MKVGDESVSVDQIKELREATGVGIMDCKRALEEAKGDTEKAVLLLREKGLARAKKRQERVAEQGVIESYLHIGSQIGSLVEINCETDFVARNSEFRELSHLIALHIAACNPLYMDRDSVPGQALEEEKEKYRARCEAEGKPENVWEEIIEGMLEKYYQEVCLLEQPFVKDPSISVEDLLVQTAAKLGERLHINRFSRFQVGETQEED